MGNKRLSHSKQSSSRGFRKGQRIACCTRWQRWLQLEERTKSAVANSLFPGILVSGHLTSIDLGAIIKLYSNCPGLITTTVCFDG